MEEPYALYQGDCLDLLEGLEPGGASMCLCDPPFGTTNNEWDSALDMGVFFERLWRVLGERAPALLFSQLPFACDCVAASRREFRYEWVWKKGLSASGFLNANRMPLRNHENVLVFYRKLPTYNPQFDFREPYERTWSGVKTTSYGDYDGSASKSEDGRRYPLDVLDFNKCMGSDQVHPTQKPVALLEYLIRTYTDEGDVVLDPTMGSGSTGVACANTGRRFVGIEKDAHWFEVAQGRVSQAYAQPRLDYG